MVDRTRHRMLSVVPARNGQYDRWLNGTYWYGSQTAYPEYGSRQVTIDEIHAWPRRKADSRADIGGPFHSVKSSLETTWHPGIYRLGSYGSELYEGPIRAQLAPSWWQFLYPGTDVAQLLAWSDMHPPNYLEGLGARAISSTIPTNPPADTAVTVAELLREGFPTLILGSLVRDRVGFFRGLGKDYLNVEFGWKPFVGGFLEIAESIVQADDLLQQLARDSGRNVRRGISFPEDRNTTYTEDNLLPHGGQSALLMTQRGRSVTVLETHKTWFSGCYTYHYDPAALTEASRIATQARLLLGITVNPEVLWNLTPWSWLVDWFTNIGPVFHNLSAFGQDGLVLRYGYLMHQHYRRETSTHRGVNLPKGGNFPTQHVSSTFQLESKRRIRATPYGFGLTFGGFSARQLAIITALGLSKT